MEIDRGLAGWGWWGVMGVGRVVRSIGGWRSGRWWGVMGLAGWCRGENEGVTDEGVGRPSRARIPCSPPAPAKRLSRPCTAAAPAASPACLLIQALSFFRLSSNSKCSPQLPQVTVTLPSAEAKLRHPHTNFHFLKYLHFLVVLFLSISKKDFVSLSLHCIPWTFILILPSLLRGLPWLQSNPPATPPQCNTFYQVLGEASQACRVNRDSLFSSFLVPFTLHSQHLSLSLYI